MLDLGQVVLDFAAAFKVFDSDLPVHKGFKPGIGPFGEREAVTIATTHLRETNSAYGSAANDRPYPGSKQTCDLVIAGEWAIEFKLIRPFGDNGRTAEHWSENVLHPYPGNTSAIGDCFKLAHSGFQERKAIIVFGFEHTPPQVSLEPAVRSFEVISRQVCGIHLGPRQSALFEELVHPFHQQGRVHGWEVHSAPPAS